MSDWEGWGLTSEYDRYPQCSQKQRSAASDLDPHRWGERPPRLQALQPTHAEPLLSLPAARTALGSELSWQYARDRCAVAAGGQIAWTSAVALHALRAGATRPAARLCSRAAKISAATRKPGFARRWARPLQSRSEHFEPILTTPCQGSKHASVFRHGRCLLSDHGSTSQPQPAVCGGRHRCAIGPIYPSTVSASCCEQPAASCNRALCARLASSAAQSEVWSFAAATLAHCGYASGRRDSTRMRVA